MTTFSIWWIRRDLRLADNPALAAALAKANTVIPVFVRDPTILKTRFHHKAHKRLAFLEAGLRQLDSDLRARGSRLIIRRGRPLEALTDLVRETGATSVVAGEDFSPYSRRRDARVARHLPLSLVSSLTVHHPEAVVKANGEPYTVFTPFSRAWASLPGPREADLLPAPERLAPPPQLDNEAAWTAQNQRSPNFLPGESQGRQVLHNFMSSGVYAYSAGRNRLDADGTSGLSPYLRFGMVSAREAAVAAQRAVAWAPGAPARKAAQAWLNELIWREFYNAILYHFPEVLQHAFRPHLRDIAWENDEEAFAAWREGLTGYPAVDAAMRQLAQTGWMHNRARMITASFLVKDLLIDWRWGEQWFMQNLIDGDPAANNGGWQWTAGVGTDAAPYFRVFNPVLQSRKFDPGGDFARAWIPELRRVPDAYIHEPWKMPQAVQLESDCVIGRHYPAPIIDHAFARRRALAAYRAREPA